jgi:hypothetical protein
VRKPRGNAIGCGGGTTECKEGPMLDGVMLLWFVLTAAALLFVAVDIRTTRNLRCSNGVSCC